jgi:plasmid stabilization system protein ParE
VITARFLPAAEAELLEVVAYYSKAGDGLGIRLANEVERTVRLAAANPAGGKPSTKGTRRRLVRGFPFSVVYRESDGELLIVALMHHRKMPGYWIGRIE